MYVLFVIKKRVGGMGIKYGRGWGGREFRFRGDLYSQESTFPLVFDSIPSVLQYRANPWGSRSKLLNLPPRVPKISLRSQEITSLDNDKIHWCRDFDLSQKAKKRCLTGQVRYWSLTSLNITQMISGSSPVNIPSAPENISHLGIVPWHNHLFQLIIFSCP